MLDAGGEPASSRHRTGSNPGDSGYRRDIDACSFYYVGEVQNNQVTITYTVYNEQADTETGVLLSTTLEPGVTLVGSTVTLDSPRPLSFPTRTGKTWPGACNLFWVTTERALP